MLSRTNNKIALCQNCIGSLPSMQKYYCNAYCRSAKAENQAERDIGAAKIWIYLNKNMLDLAKSQGVIAHEFSFFIWSGHELVGIACFDEKELQSIGDHETNAYDAWWRGVNDLNTSFEALSSSHMPHRPRVMRKTGILSYLCDEYGISTEKNVAAAIGAITRLEGLRSPMELFNTL